MKKKQLLLTMMLLLASVTGVYAEGEGALSITNVKNVVPGYTGSFDIVLSGSTKTYAGYQFTLTLPEGLTYDSYSNGELIDGHTATITGDAVKNFTGAANPTANFTAMNGTLLTIYFTVSGTATGTLEGCSLTTVRMSDENSNPSALADVNFSVEVGNTITLDENEDYTPVAISNVNVNMKRALKANTWSTIVHPFAMTAEQVTATFGEGVKIGYFTGMEPTYTGEDLTSVAINFEERTSIEAHTPYIIKVPTAKPDGYTVNGVDVTAFTGNIGLYGETEKPLVNSNGAPIYEGPSVVYGEMKRSGPPSNYKYYYDYDNTANDMIGTYKSMTIPQYYLFLNNNTFVFSTGKSKLKGFRASFYNPWVYYTTSNPSRSFIINFNDGSESTGVSAQKITAPIDGFYSLTGQQVKNPAKGIYITRGKKVIIK